MMAQISETEARLNSHEEVCKIRYESINARLKRIEQILMASAAFIMVTHGTIVLKLPN